MRTNESKYQSVIKVCYKFFQSEIKESPLIYVKACSKITDAIHKTLKDFDYKTLLSELKTIRKQFRSK
jgi:hypothetical protein